MLEELIQLAKDIRAARQRGEESGLSDEEVAFYDALAQNESARQVMGEPALRVIAHELVTSIRNSVSVDWMHREAARARMRVLVKRILRKYGYPPTCRMPQYRMCCSRLRRCRRSGPRDPAWRGS
jgi:type I restriction enzyme, R subunit